MSLRRLGFARWISAVPSGGNRYDDELAAGLRALGVDVPEYAVPGPWPMTDQAARRRLAELLRNEQDWLMDNILAAGAPEAIAAARAAGRRVTVLVHYFPADELGWTPAERDRLVAAERKAIIAASAVVATSAWTAGEVEVRYGRSDAVVAVPGVTPAPLARGSSGTGPPRLLWLARLTRTKDPLTLVDALVRLVDLDWVAELVGPDRLDTDLTREVRDRLATVALSDRIKQPGPRTGTDLERRWAATDLLVLTSRVEPYGMVVTEALARGIPSIVPADTGAVEAQRVGAAFPAGDADALADVLRRWLTDRGLRRRWREAAVRERSTLPAWRATAETVLATLTRVP